MKPRDYTPQMARAHVAPVGLYSPNSNTKPGMCLSQLSPHAGETGKPAAEAMENILIQTLSPRGLKHYYADKEPAWREPKSTQHKDLMVATGAVYKEEPRAGEIYSRPGGMQKKGTGGQLFGSQHTESGKSTAAAKYQTQTRKTPVYESVMEQQKQQPQGKHHAVERRKPYYY